MRYVIKDINDGRYVVTIDESTYWFALTNELDRAKKFSSLFEAISQIVWRAKHNPSFGLYYTVSGVEEISNPQYREVEL